MNSRNTHRASFRSGSSMRSFGVWALRPSLFDSENAERALPSVICILSGVLVILLSVLSFSACNDHSPTRQKPLPAPTAPTPAPAPVNDGRPTPPPAPTPELPLGLTQSTASMQETLVASRCLSCHESATAGNRFVDLRDLTAIYTDQPTPTVPGEARKVIRVGCPDASIFFLEIKNDKMPPNGAHPILAADRKIISDWIVSLAPAGVINCSDEPPD
jgi:hypothetical protein